MVSIDIKNATKAYGKKGVFNLTMQVEKGTSMGFLGPNGSGKTTTIRMLMGFIKADSGTLTVNGFHCFEQSEMIRRVCGYLAGEIAFIDRMSGIDFIYFAAKLQEISDMARAKQLIDFFELDPNAKIKRMSKGMKQKIGMVCAFMADPELYILDEPTSGLDPLMQNKFVELIQSEKERGKTFLMSSHIFEEIEKTCDKTLIIRDGRAVLQKDMSQLSKDRAKNYKIEFSTELDRSTFEKRIIDTSFILNFVKPMTTKGTIVEFSIIGNTHVIIDSLYGLSVTDIQACPQTLEELFIHCYNKEGGT